MEKYKNMSLMQLSFFENRTQRFCQQYQKAAIAIHLGVSQHIAPTLTESL